MRLTHIGNAIMDQAPPLKAGGLSPKSTPEGDGTLVSAPSPPCWTMAELYARLFFAITPFVFFRSKNVEISMVWSQLHFRRIRRHKLKQANKKRAFLRWRGTFREIMTSIRGKFLCYR